jgi:hypothetical protein
LEYLFSNLDKISETFFLESKFIYYKKVGQLFHTTSIPSFIFRKEKIISMNCEGWEGSSGCGIFDEKYNLVGIIDGGDDPFSSLFGEVIRVGHLRGQIF